MRRNILITGATGKQGQAAIRALLRSSSQDPDHQYHIYALTRNASSPTAKSLRETEPGVSIVEGDLDDPNSVSEIFENAKSEGGIWGVFVVLMYPGLGAEAHGEERQGKLMADLAHRYEVQIFIYSSASRAGPKYDDKLELSGKAKLNIEIHCKELGEKGLPWVIIRPGFFMENFNDFIGSMTGAVLKSGLKKDTTVEIIAADDIGNVVASIFQNHEKYIHKEMAIAAEAKTIEEIREHHIEATGKPMPAVPQAFGWMIIKTNKGVQKMIQAMELSHQARTSGDYPTWEAEVAMAHSAYKMKTYAEWVKQGKRDEARTANWNQVTLGKILTGRQ